jgi:DNA-binding FrmR family transcriptional regulator
MIMEDKHTHIAEDGTVYEHTHHDHEHHHEHEHGHHEHGHHHGHTHTNTKAVLNRLSRAIGHLESIKRMVEDGRDCSEVLIQLSAVKSAINNTGKVILKEHIEHCMVEAVESGDHEAIEELTEAIDRFMK